MIGAGIGWMVMGGLYFLRHKITFAKLSVKIYKLMFISGLVVLLISLINKLFFDNIILFTLSALILPAMGIYFLKLFKDWQTAQDVMYEMTRGE